MFVKKFTFISHVHVHDRMITFLAKITFLFLHVSQRACYTKPFHPIISVRIGSLPYVRGVSVPWHIGLGNIIYCLFEDMEPLCGTV